MKKITTALALLLIVLFLDSKIVNAQNRNQVQQNNQQKEKLLELSKQFHQKFLEQRAEVERVALEKGWPIRIESEEGVREIQYISTNGMPQYYTTHNLNAARTINTDDLWVGPYNLTGSGFTVGEWDGGGVRTTHQEFDGRVTQMDSPGSTHWHSTHVAGTIVAQGQVGAAHGMAHEALLEAYDWTDDETEMASAASGGLTLSNHSYGFNRGWVNDAGIWYWFGDPTISSTEDYLFGFYDAEAQSWDQIANDAPHYLICKSSGNDRNDDHSGSHYYWNGSSWVASTAARDADGGTDGYDCIDQHGVPKNILTVGAVNDITGGWTQPSDVVMSTFSSWGPTDDGRIKPDLVANGVNLYSTDDDSNSDYTYSDGTSMSTPSVTGTLALLQDYYEDLRGGYMSAAALKGLAINTANEAGPNPGPDYMFGWGLMNATGAADLITDDDTEGGLIVEGILEDNHTINYTYYCDGSSDVNVTLIWNDPAHAALSPSLNPTTSVLVNDLDLLILDEAKANYYPWRLNPSSPASPATNISYNYRDNVETVTITSPAAGYYTIRVNEYSTLPGGQQAYSLIVNGMSTPQTNSYCDVSSNPSLEQEYISKVIFGDIDNTSGLAPGGYADYTGLVTTITKGTSETITVTTGMPYSGDDGYAWVDWNQDSDFDDPGEYFSLGTGLGPYISTITAPIDAVDGYTTMRVRLVDSYGSNPCGESSWGETEDYTINVIPIVPNEWTGAFNIWWHNAQNWSLGHIPTADEDVIITSAGWQPKCDANYNEECNNLTILSGATLNIVDDQLIVNGDVSISGTLGMINNNAVITCYGDFAWNSGSSANITATAKIYAYGDWNFNSGANANLTNGFVDFMGSTSNWIRSYSNNCSFYNLRVYKTGGAAARVSNLSNYDLVVNNLTFVSTGAILQSWSNNDIVMKGYFNYYGTFDFTQNDNTGSVIFDGTTQGINNYNSGSGTFNNIVFSSTTSTTLSNDNMIVMGDLTIESGTFNSNGLSVEVHGSWNKTGGNYLANGSVVTFNGNGFSFPHEVNGTNTFYDVVQLNTGTYLRFNDPTTISNNLELHYRSWAYDIMAINGSLNIDDVSSRFSVYSDGDVTISTLNQGGEIVVANNCTLTANDLFESGIEGTYHLILGEINLTQDAGSFPDFNADIIIEEGEFILNGGSGTSWWAYGGDASLTMSGGVFDFNNAGCNIYNSTNTLSVNITDGTIRTAGSFLVENAAFAPIEGLLEFYSSNDGSFRTTLGSNVNNVLINKNAKSGSKKYKLSERDVAAGFKLDGGSPKANEVTMTSDVDINGNFTIDNGVFNTNTHNMFLAGNWTNNVGPSGFEESTGRVTFDGPGHQYVYSDETFNVLEANMGAALRVANADHAVTCNSYDWTTGGVDILSGTFTALDLEDNGIFGGFWVNPDGIINLYKPTGFADLNGDLTFSGGGEINIYGTGTSFIPYANDASITMNGGGVLDFKTTDVQIHNNHELTTNITGGIIRTTGDFWGYRTDFNPTAGIFEFYGTAPQSIYQLEGTFFDVVINNIADDGNSIGGNSIVADKRDKYNKDIGEKGSNVSLLSDVTITNELYINSGILELYGQELTVGRSCNVWGTLTLDNPADILNMGINGADQLNFFDGSTGNFSNGVANIYGWVVPLLGCSFTGSTDNTIIFKGVSGGGLSNVEPSAVFGNIEIHKNANQRTFIADNSVEPIIVNGNFTIYPDNEFETRNQTMYVHGIVSDNATSEMYLYSNTAKAKDDSSSSKDMNTIIYNQKSVELPVIKTSLDTKSGSKGGYVEIDNDFTLNGLMDVGDGTVLLHGHYDQETTGILSINSGGSFICDEPTTSPVYVRGIFNMTGGLFEISNNHLFHTASSTISNGTIRIGGTFRAFNDGNFKPTGGVVELVGSGAGNYILLNANNYFHDLTINRTNQIQIYTDYDLYIRNNFTILSGGLNSNNRDMYVWGNWINNLGTSGFSSTTSTVTFGGPNHAQILPSDQHFYNLTLEKSSSALFLDSYGNIDIYNNFLINKGNYYPHENTMSVQGNVTINDGGSLNLVASSKLELDDGSIVDVNSGGELNVTGNTSNYSTITHNSSGSYTFNINTGGTIAAEHAIFEYMDGNGISVKLGANVDPSFTFNHCIFRNGLPSPSTLLSLNTNNVFTCTGAHFENNSGTTGFNVWKFEDGGEVTFVDATGDFTGELHEYDPNNRVHWTYPTRSLDLTVFMEGPFDESSITMNTDINNLLPLAHPFNPSLPYYGNPYPDWLYYGLENVGSIPNTFVVDWVLVELRDATSVGTATSITEFETIPAFVLNNGKIVDLDGVSPLTLFGSPANKLFAVIWHRNHLGIISKTPLLEGGSVYTYDFSSDPNQAYGSDAQIQLSVSPPVWGMRSGDGDGDGDVGLSDKVNVWYNLAGKIGYNGADFNMNSQVNNQDKDDKWLRNFGSSSYVPE